MSKVTVEIKGSYKFSDPPEEFEIEAGGILYRIPYTKGSLLSGKDLLILLLAPMQHSYAFGRTFNARLNPAKDLAHFETLNTWAAVSGVSRFEVVPFFGGSSSPSVPPGIEMTVTYEDSGDVKVYSSLGPNHSHILSPAPSTASFTPAVPPVAGGTFMDGRVSTSPSVSCTLVNYCGDCANYSFLNLTCDKPIRRRRDQNMACDNDCFRSAKTEGR